MVLEMVLESLFAVVDVFWVSRLGADAIATVGLTESILTLVFAVGLGLGIATTAMVARRIGEKDPDGAAVSAVQAIVLGLGTSVVLGVLFLFLAPRLLGWMGAGPAIVATGTNYMRIALGGSGVVLLLFLNNAIFRGAGDAAIAMRLLWVSNILNLILDPCLIFGLGPFPRMGVTGAALATFSGRGIAVLYQFYRLSQGTERLRILGRHVRVEGAVLWRLVRTSVTGIVQFLIGQASWLGLVRIVSLFGASALAGYTIAIRIVIFAILPAWGLSNAAANACGAESWGGASGSGSKCRVADGALECNLSRVRGCGVYCLCAMDHWPVYAGPCGGAHSGEQLEDLQLREYGLCVRDGASVGLQWRGGHVDANVCESVRVLGGGDPAGVVAGDAYGAWGEWGVRVGGGGAVGDRADQPHALSPWEVGGSEDLKGKVARWRQGPLRYSQRSRAMA